MTMFEFILVMVSLILAIAVTHLLHGLARVARYRETLETDWVPLAWAGSLFILSALHWWARWDFRSVDWTFPAFFFVLLPPTLFYVAVALLVSADVAGPGASMTTEFEKVRKLFLTTMAVWWVLVSIDGWVLGTERFWNSLRLVQVAGMGLILLGLVSPARAVQRLVAAGMLVLVILIGFVLRLLPGAFGPP